MFRGTWGSLEEGGGSWGIRKEEGMGIRPPSVLQTQYPLLLLDISFVLVETHCQGGKWKKELKTTNPVHGAEPSSEAYMESPKGSLQAGLPDCVWTSVPVTHTQSLPAGPFLLTSLLVFVLFSFSCGLVPVVFATLPFLAGFCT